MSKGSDSSMPQNTANMRVVEGSYAVAHAVMCCRPDVISAYPITPQTHIVENLSQLVADGELDSAFLTVDSEFSALSVLVGSTACGGRGYSSTTSQGLALMYEVLYNVSGMRLPIVMTVANRAIGAPLNIWNDQQDSVGARDVGWLQIYVENVQEAVDATLQAYKIAEDPEIRTPIMVCMDGFILTHVYEPVELLDKEKAREFLPDFKPESILDPNNPLTFGAFADPSTFTEFRYQQFAAHQKALEKIEQVARDFERAFGRYYGGLVDSYCVEGAEVVIVTMGSIIGTIKDAIDEMRAEGIKVGLVKVRCYRPFPAAALRKALSGAKVIAVVEKDVSIGNEAGLVTDLKASFYNSDIRTPIIGFVAGLGGRDITIKDIRKMVEKALAAEKGIECEFEFLDLRKEIL
ncbi:MAG: pyruvate ferredoxin oxidoreductase [Methanothrix sp.]|jgi:pyruvate ferredoxin oxidoreductase alpha subunit|uniref:transketolase C-terminal domain-containing protein n=1 Tax=Methanothrix sp. TaxID=90426 RepID=UPI0025F0DB64|nr:transketolase C-terminal domain-containing protein [Methanothrix sp.]MCK9405182.1 pyruvate ferredoxin oxidoreductase [Methanothrix sp.]